MNFWSEASLANLHALLEPYTVPKDVAYVPNGVFQAAARFGIPNYVH